MAIVAGKPQETSSSDDRESAVVLEDDEDALDDDPITTTVYFLANLSHTATRSIKNELEMLDELDDSMGFSPNDRKQFTYVHWPNNMAVDGTEADILRITKEKSNAIFVDARSADDKTVILASAEMWYHELHPEGWSGETGSNAVAYGRCKGREALLSWVNLDIGNMHLNSLIIEDEPVTIPFNVQEPTTLQEDGKELEINGE